MADLARDVLQWKGCWRFKEERHTFGDAAADPPCVEDTTPLLDMAEFDDWPETFEPSVRPLGARARTLAARRGNEEIDGSVPFASAELLRLGALDASGCWSLAAFRRDPQQDGEDQLARDRKGQSARHGDELPHVVDG